MLARIRRSKRGITVGLLSAAVFGLVACATDKQQVSLVDDPDAKKESAIPWNKQEKWEQGAAMGGIANSDRGR
jgi:hypothetical protein